jgi:hypothetical protein
MTTDSDTKRAILNCRKKAMPSKSSLEFGSRITTPTLDCLRIPMMSISHSDLMPIRSERSDAGLSQFEILIGIRQEFCWFSLS